ncbi:MAG: hypothetical protein D3921_04835 [Candidatus Electrothrix sp. AW1]|nr:hypothetical protein [Candidatus Electrothrix sp. AX1]MCI5181835.1 hypothetical protein [Candidatus Electrothrix gigas]
MLVLIGNFRYFYFFPFILLLLCLSSFKFTIVRNKQKTAKKSRGGAAIQAAVDSVKKLLVSKNDE